MPLPGGPFPAQFPIGSDNDSPEGVDAYTRQLKLLLPPGRAFNTDEGTIISDTLEALASELTRVDQRVSDVLAESDPRQTVEMIADWEKALSLPDDRVTEISTDLATRQVAVTQKYTARGGQSYSYFAKLFAACGYPLASVTLFANSLLRAGFRVNDRVYGAAYAYSIQFNISAPAGAAVDHPTLERIVSHIVHSHITPIFNYL